MSTIHTMSRHFRSALLLGSALSLLPTVVSAQESAGAVLENIVVTAQKREQNLQVVPVAVTAITKQSLDLMRFENFTSLSAVAPGVTVRTGPGGQHSPNVTIRGVYGSGTFASDPGVALYVDGLYLSGVIGASMDLADVERVEILRGPQGTLFGRNAIGGAISVITREPTGEFGGRQQFSFGNLNQFRSKTTINLPAWGALSASVTYLHDERDGDVKNLGAGQVWDYGPATGGSIGQLVSPKTLGGHNTNAVSAVLKLEPGSDIKAIYRFNYQHKRYAPPATGIASFDTGPGTNAFLGGLFQSFWAGQNPALRTPISTTRPDAVNNWHSLVTPMTDQSHSLTVTMPVNDMISLKNILAYRRVEVYSANQLSGLGGVLLAPGLPLMAIENDSHSRQKSFQEEFQVNIDTKWVKSTIGYMHYHSQTKEGGIFGPNASAPNALFGSGVFPGVPVYTNFIAPAGTGAIPNDVNMTSDAVYSQNEIHITDQLDLVLGGRYTWDRRGGLDNSPTPATPGVPVTYSKSTPTYLVGVNYKVTDEIFAFAKLSSAYISGGRLANIAFEPSFAKSYEVGIKSDLLNNRLRLNLTGYTVKYTALQVLTNPAQGCAGIPGVSPFASQCIVSGGNEKVKGLEAEIAVVPVEGLTLAGNVGLTDAKLTKTPANLLAPDGTFANGFVPKWTATASASYRGPEMDSLRGSHFFARIEVDYASGSFASTPNSVRSVAIASSVPSRWLLDANIGLGGFQVGGGEVEISAFAKNLTDNKSITYTFNAAAMIPASYQEARTYGLNLNFDF